MTIRLGETQTTFKAPAHLMDPSRTVFAWFTDPPGIFIQFARRAVFSLPFGLTVSVESLSDAVRSLSQGTLDA